MKHIAHIENSFDEKFGVPRQAGLADIKGKIVFEKEYRSPEAIRGLEGFSHIWIIWETSESITDKFSPTVRPPRLGGNTRLGVFATRSPFRPNPIGLSCVELEKTETDPELGPVLYVRGADMVNRTPIYDIKPYIPYCDCKINASEGFATMPEENLKVTFECEADESIKKDLGEILRLDPRPRYQADGKEYTFTYSGKEVKFVINDNEVKVKDISE